MSIWFSIYLIKLQNIWLIKKRYVHFYRPREIGLWIFLLEQIYRQVWAIVLGLFRTPAQNCRYTRDPPKEVHRPTQILYIIWPGHQPSAMCGAAAVATGQIRDPQLSSCPPGHSFTSNRGAQAQPRNSGSPRVTCYQLNSSPPLCVQIIQSFHCPQLVLIVLIVNCCKICANCQLLQKV